MRTAPVGENSASYRNHSASLFPHPDGKDVASMENASNSSSRNERILNQDNIILSNHAMEALRLSENVTQEPAENHSRFSLRLEDHSFVSAQVASDLFSSRQVTRITNQLREMTARAVSSSSISWQTALGDSASGSAILMGGKEGIQIQTYIEMIKQLAEDDQALNNFLKRFEAFLQKDQEGNVSMEEMAEEFAVDMQSYYSQTAVVEEQAEHSETAAAQLEVIQHEDGSIEIREVVQQADPLVFDLDGEGFELTDVDNGVSFDINADGQADKTAFVQGGDAFLALDRNNNGTIDGGHELFGDQHGATDGLDELRKFDSNIDGVIDSTDGIFSSLRLFTDKNMDGKSQPGELRTLLEEGIVSIDLNGETSNQNINGNRISVISSYQRQDGTHHQIGDAFLNFIG